MRNELGVMVSVDMTVPALTDVESKRKSERSMWLTLWLPATATVCWLSSEKNLDLEEEELDCIVC
jgi:hypothetical protein